MSRVKIALAGGLLLTALAISLTLLRSPTVIVRKNATLTGEEALVTVTHGKTFCQSREALPQGTTAIQPGLSANTGPAVHAEVKSGGRVLTSGRRGAGWNGRIVTIPLTPLAHSVPDATICVSFDVHDETIGVHGFQTSRANGILEGDKALPERMWLNFVRPGHRRWISQLSSIARRMELDRTTTGIWIVLLAFALDAVAVALAILVTLRALDRDPEPPESPSPKAAAAKPRSARAGKRGVSRGARGSPAGRTSGFDVRATLRAVPRAAWMCALIACLNAACWSIITPPFQVPDEPDHFSYVKQLVDTGTRPTTNEGAYPTETSVALEALGFYHMIEQPEDYAISSQAEHAEMLRRIDNTSGASVGSANAGVATAQPPLYYAIEAVPYALEQHDPIPDRIQLMRLFSALFAGLTALFVFLFARELLPSEPWAWVVGGVAVAVAPLLGFMSGAINPDSMLYAVSAAIFYCLARAFRRGLSNRMAVTIGAVTAIGLLTKLNFAGLLPGIMIALIILSVRVARGSSRSVGLKRFALSAGIGLSPGVLLLAIEALKNHALLGPFAHVTELAKGSLFGQINYIWQLYLPHLPGTVNDFPGTFTTRQFWFDGYVGLFGWRDTRFPSWVYNVALIPAGVLVALCARALYESRSAVRSRVPELLVYVAISIGVMAMVGAASYGAFPGVDAEYFEVRYLFPMLALLGVVLALAARGAGRRWGPAAGALIVVLFIAHDLLSQMLMIGRYYG